MCEKERRRGVLILKLTLWGKICFRGRGEHFHGLHRGPQAAHDRAQAPFMENLYAPSGLHALEVPEDTFVEMLLAVCKVFMSQKALS